mmetsp:Transcript_119081/g.237485  ORF Transcript_119081/g.237485 Transcript_119081/m.237485 type:complete len:94 (+) Transcript_119081:467-748(+)
MAVAYSRQRIALPVSPGYRSGTSAEQERTKALLVVAVSAHMLKKTWATGVGISGARRMFRQHKRVACYADPSTSAPRGLGASRATSGAAAFVS